MSINKTFLFIPDDDDGDLYLDIDTGNVLGVFVYEYETSERNPENPIEMLTSEDIVIGFETPVKDAEPLILMSGFEVLDEANRALKLDIIRNLERSIEMKVIEVETPNRNNEDNEDEDEDGDRDKDREENKDKNDNDNDNDNGVIPFK